MRKYVPFALLKQGEKFYTIDDRGTPEDKCIKTVPMMVIQPGSTFGGPEINAIVLETGHVVQCKDTHAVIRESDISDSTRRFMGVANKMPTVESVYADLGLAMWYTPDAIRDHFNGEDNDYALWVQKATTQDLVELGRSILDSDTTWSDFHEHIIMAIDKKVRKDHEAN